MGYRSPLIFVSAARTRDRPSRHRVTVDQDSSPRQNDANNNNAKRSNAIRCSATSLQTARILSLPLLALVFIRQFKTLSELTLSNQLQLQHKPYLQLNATSNNVTSITTTTTMIIATYPSTEVRLNAIYSHLKCLSEGVDKIIVSAPDWSYDVMSNFSIHIQSRLPHEIYKKITFQFYINDRYDAGLWCDALDDKMGERNTTTSSTIDDDDNDATTKTTNYLLINDSLMTIRPFTGLLDNITSSHHPPRNGRNDTEISFVSLSYWPTNRVEDPIWLESPARAFNPRGIQIFHEQICKKLNDTIGRECAARRGEKRKRCIVEHTEIDVARYYNSTEILGLYPGMVPEDMRIGGQIGWTGNYQFWKNVLVDELNFPFVKVSHGFLDLVPENVQSSLFACSNSSY